MPLSNTDIVSDELLTATNGVHARPGAIGSENNVSGRIGEPLPHPGPATGRRQRVRPSCAPRPAIFQAR